MDLFKEIQRDRFICNNCFRRIHDVFERNYAVRSNGGTLYAEEIDAPPEIRPTLDATRMPANRLTAGTRIVCYCGMSCAKQRPLNKTAFIRYGKRLANRIEEVGFVDFDRDLFFDELIRAKRDPSRQFADDRLYQEATAVSTNTP